MLKRVCTVAQVGQETPAGSRCSETEIMVTGQKESGRGQRSEPGLARSGGPRAPGRGKVTAKHARGARAWLDRPETTWEAKGTQADMVPSCGRFPRPLSRSKQSTHLTDALSPLLSRQARSQVSSAGVNCPGRTLAGLVGRATGLQLPGCTTTAGRRFSSASTDIPANRQESLPSKIQSLCEEGGSPVAYFLRSKWACLRREVLPRLQPWLRGFGFLIRREVSPLLVGAGYSQSATLPSQGPARACRRPRS